MTSQYQFYTADVFTTDLFNGAQIAVFPHAAGLSERQMQLVAGELNLSQTVFVFPADDPANTRRLRIFSPLEEAAFGGHPIIAAGYVLGAIGELDLSDGRAEIALEQNIGVIRVFVTLKQGQPTFVQFTMKVEPMVDRFTPPLNEIAEFLTLDRSQVGARQFVPMLASCGNPYLIVPVASHASLRAARFNFKAWSQSAAPEMLAREILLFSCGSADLQADFHGRLVGPHIGVIEDPPIGSAIPAFAAYLCAHQHIKQGIYPFTIARGDIDTRLSRLNVEMHKRQSKHLTLRVGGPAVMVSEGRMNIPDL